MSDTPELPPEWMEHPMVKDLLERLTALEAKIGDFSVKKDQLAVELKQATQDRQDFEASIQEQLRQYKSRERELAQMERQITSEMYSAKNLADTMKSEVGDLIAGLAAHAELEVAKEAWDAILADQDWLWIKSIFEYQKTGAEFITSGLTRGTFGTLLADQMGLGKTLQATAAINLMQYTDNFEEIIGPRCPRLPNYITMPNGERNYPPAWYSVLYIVPNALKASTMREIAKWSSDLNVIKLEGNQSERNNIVKIAHKQGMVLVCSYEQLRQRNDMDLTPAIFEYDWPIVVMDEAHKFKNDTSSTFQAVKRICKNAGYLIPMTGTPIMNRPSEMWSMLHMLTLKGKYEGKFEHLWKFESDYLNTWGGSTQFQQDGYDRLVKSVADMVLRRRKDEVLLDLPDKIREVRFVDMTGKQLDLYNELRDKLFVWLDDDKENYVSTSSILAQLTRLRQIAVLPAGVKIADPDGSNEKHLDCWESAKIDEAMALVEELMEANEKVLIFSNFNEPLKYLAKLIEEKGWTFTDRYNDERPFNAEIIMGGVHEVKRDQIAARFNDDQSNTRVLLGNIGAMGVGLNLQGACSHAIFLDLFWNPGVNEQAEDRLHRQGQKNSVTIHIIQAEDSVDAFIADKLEKKALMIEGVIERDELRAALKSGLI